MAHIQHGFTFPDGADGLEFCGRWVLETLWFNRCIKGFAKPMGNIGNTVRNCGFHECEYGYWAQDVYVGEIMQGSNDDFHKCEFHSSVYAAIYINSDTSVAGQTSFNDCIIENNLGMGVFVRNYLLCITPLVFENC